jgi:DNA-binding ferritin-like protein (Dps family)
LAKLNEKYDKSKQNVAAKGREIKTLKERIKELEKELTLDKVVAEIRRVLWTHIGQSITDQWQYIETIHEKMELIGKAQREVHRARASLGSMPEIASRMINVLNNRTGPQLAAIGISNRTETIQLIKRVLTLKSLVQTLDRRSQDMQTEVNRFMDKFATLQGRGLPSLLNSAGKLLSHEVYAKRVNTFATNQISQGSSSSQATGPASGQSLYDRVENLFFIMNEISHLFEVPPNFYKYTEADETLDAILRHQLPTQEWWTSMIQLLL